MEERNPEATVPTAGRDVTAGDGPKPPWTKPEIRVMKVVFTHDGDGRIAGDEPDDPDDGGQSYIPDS